MHHLLQWKDQHHQEQCWPIFRLAQEIVFEDSIYEASLQALLNLIVNFDESAEKVFLIGHNPSLCMLADYLTEEEIYSLPTSGTVYIRFEIEKWGEISKGLGHLEWLKTPKML
jgi:phosphohistidine phosphatase